MVRLSRTDPGALIASVLAHCVLAASGVWFWAARDREPPPVAPAVEVELAEEPRELEERVAEGQTEPGPAEPRARQPDPVAPGGGEHAPRPDVGVPGRGGVQRGERATNLSSSIDPLTLEREAPNHLTKSEVQRLRVARVRRTRDDRRATPQPMELDFVASGRGRLALRRPPAAVDASPGLERGVPPRELGAAAGADPGADPVSAAGSRRVGTEAVPALGIPASTGVTPSHGAAVMTARPFVQRDRAAVPAAQRDTPSDTVESRQRVASRIAGLLQASTLGSANGDGPGGEVAPAPPAAAGDWGRGSRASPSGHGAGPLRDLAGDPGLQGYYRHVTGRLDRALRETFPRWAIAEGRGGVVVFDLILLEDGRVASVSVVRPSGIDEYDRNVVDRVRQIPSFGRLPSAFGHRAVIRFSYDSVNPAVGRRGPGPGHRPE